MLLLLRLVLSILMPPMSVGPLSMKVAAPEVVILLLTMTTPSGVIVPALVTFPVKVWLVMQMPWIVVAAGLLNVPVTLTQAALAGEADAASRAATELVASRTLNCPRCLPTSYPVGRLDETVSAYGTCSRRCDGTVNEPAFTVGGKSVFLLRCGFPASR